MFPALESHPCPVVRLDYPLLSKPKLAQLGLRLIALLLAAACGFWLGRMAGHEAETRRREARPPVSFLPSPSDTLRVPQATGNANLGAMLQEYSAGVPGAQGTPGPRMVEFRTWAPDPRTAQLHYALAVESDGTPYRGELKMEIAGLRGGHLEVLQAPGPEAAVASPQRLLLSFSRYVKTEGTVLLPPGFTPLFVGASLPGPGSTVTRKLTCPA